MTRATVHAALLASVLILAAGLEAAIEPEVLFEAVLADYELAYGTAIATDDAGNAYLAANFHAAASHNDVVVAKVGPDGTVLWETPIQATQIDIARGIALDGAGDPVVVGFTDSPDFPVTPDGLQPTFVGFRDAFLLRLSAVDGAITYGTFLGGSHASTGDAVTVAGDGTIWLAGSTDSPDFPTVNPLQANLGNYQYQYDDVVIAAISADGQSLLYSSYLGASDDDRSIGIALRPDGTIVVAGETGSPDFPGIDGFQPNLHVGSDDGFVATIAADGSAILHATYLGGSLGEVLRGFALGPDGSVHLAGLTSSEDLPTTPDAVQPDFVGAVLGCEIPFAGDRNCYDGFVVRLSPDLATLVFGSYLGGTEDDVLDGVAVGEGGRVHVSGWTYSSDFPVTSGPAGFGMIAAQLPSDAGGLDYAVLLDADGSTNSGHAVTVGPMGSTIYYTGARHVPAQVYVARLTGAGLLFQDGFEDGTTAAW